MNQIDELSSNPNTSKKRISKQKQKSIETIQIKAYRKNKRGKHKEENERNIEILYMIKTYNMHTIVTPKSHVK